MYPNSFTFCIGIQKRIGSPIISIQMFKITLLAIDLTLRRNSNVVHSSKPVHIQKTQLTRHFMTIQTQPTAIQV